MEKDTLSGKSLLSFAAEEDTELTFLEDPQTNWRDVERAYGQSGREILVRSQDNNSQPVQ